MIVEPFTAPVRRRWPVRRTITIVMVVGVVGFLGSGLFSEVQKARNAARRSNVL
jgi:hypothetical protein